MAGIYIPGMEMPVFEHQSWDIRKGADGKWYMVDTNAETSDGEWHEIIPVPKHGRLIDADALTREQGFHDFKYENGLVYVQVCEVAGLINDAPTIIPADPPKEES